MRVHHVNKARKSPGSCGGCRKTIAKGEPYKHVKAYRGPKRIRCAECQFRPSDLTSSEKISRALGAQEDTQDRIREWRDGGSDDLEELRVILQEGAQEIRDVGEEYREASEAVRDSFPESPHADEMEEKADMLEEWADRIQEPDLEEYDAEQHDDRDSWREHQWSHADDALNDCPV